METDIQTEEAEQTEYARQMEAYYRELADADED